MLRELPGVGQYGHTTHRVAHQDHRSARDHHSQHGVQIPAQLIGSYDTELVKEFFVAVANNAGLTLHIRQLAGVNSHHIVEACFKAFARALRLAVEVDPRRAGAIPSSKGVLEQVGA